MGRISGPIYEFSGFRLEPGRHLLWRNGEAIRLSPKACEALRVLLENAGRTLSKEELMGLVWPDTAVEENNLSQLISALRRALGETAGENRFIVTLPGRGYRFVATVSARENSDGNAEAADQQHLRAVGTPNGMAVEAPDNGGPSSAPLAGGNGAQAEALPGSTAVAIPSVRAGRRWVLAIWVPLAGVLLFTALILAVDPGGVRERVLNWSRATPTSLAVLPFSNASEDPENQYLSDGVTDELTNALGKVEGLRVAARGSALHSRADAQNPRKVGQQLGVGVLLVGTVSRAGDRLRVTAQLVRTRDAVPLWSGQFDGQARDVLAIEQQIVVAVSEVLRGAGTARRSGGVSLRTTPSAEAYDLYLQGRFFWSKRNLKSMLRSLELFEGAIRKDPGFAQAHAGLADAYVVMAVNGQMKSEEAVPRGRAAAMTALELDPDSAEAHAALGLLKGSCEWEWSAGEKELRRAVQINPNYATARQWLALNLMARGRFEEAAAELRTAQLLDPLSFMMTYSLGENFYYWRRYDAAVEQGNKVEQMDPGGTNGHNLRGRAYLQKGMYREAAAEARIALDKVDGPAWKQYILSQIQAFSGDRAGAIRLIHREAKSWGLAGIPPSYIAHLYAALNEKDPAFQWLEKAYHERDPNLSSLKVEPALDALRSDPRYRELLVRVNLAN